MEGVGFASLAVAGKGKGDQVQDRIQAQDGTGENCPADGVCDGTGPQSGDCDGSNCQGDGDCDGTGPQDGSCDGSNCQGTGDCDGTGPHGKQHRGGR